ncbi:LAME_0H00452g1_1 [Lachancea meyersii CBS 8951]|uniref:Protein PXR1 n=1 Tax=Lachancea meyersii CBS 8951 TaxID=1266667 RepID=A0A1G4KDG7_9SACH|nr:LAME_0H00452g1_1 [Lachancea meyersii CBS 8951]
MGLAAVKNKQKLGIDPRNTNWSNDTSRFGHKHLEKMGWKPGSGLGLMPNSTTTHVKVSIKDDTLGLGAKLRNKKKTDEFDTGECAGLDAFQRLLGRLNGKEETVSNELETQRKDNIINGKWGIHFVKGDVLASTWDAKTKTLKKYSNHSIKRARSDHDDSSDDAETRKSKKGKKDKKADKKDKKRLFEDASRKRSGETIKNKSDATEEATLKKYKREKKEKKDKKDKKAKGEKKKKDKAEKKVKKDSTGKKDGKIKKDKKDKHKKISKQEKITREEMLKPKSQGNDEIVSRLSVRSKWIKQKRAAVMDAKALNEIFMIAS